MFIPKHFEANDKNKITEFLAKNSFGELISIVDGKPWITPAPFLYDESGGALFLHIARANPQWQQIDNTEVVFVVNGPHGYISPSWYSEAGVPTWNYQSVQLSGLANAFSDPERLAAIVNRLTRLAEAPLVPPWQPDYPESMLRGIVGIEITVSDIQCKFKLSQNRSLVDQEQVANQLEKSGNIELADAMRQENAQD